MQTFFKTNPKTMHLPLSERIEFYSHPVPECGCWIWLGAGDRYGYGTIVLGPGVQVRAHRASWIAANGPIPDGLQVLHRCDVPSCVNPEHLFLGTPKDNAEDRTRKGRHRVRGPALPRAEAA